MVYLALRTSRVESSLFWRPGPDLARIGGLQLGTDSQLPHRKRTPDVLQAVGSLVFRASSCLHRLLRGFRPLVCS